MRPKRVLFNTNGAKTALLVTAPPRDVYYSLESDMTYFFSILGIS